MNCLEKKTVAVALLLFLIVAGAAGISVATQHGVGIESDSVMYICAAQSLYRGAGYTVDGDRLSLFPPMYSLLISIPARFHIEFFSGIRLVQVILFASNICLVALVVFELTNGSVALSLLISILFLASEDVLLYHSFCLSEALFLFFTLCAFYCLIRFLRSGQIRQIIAASLFIALASMTRYSGCAWIASVGLILLLIDWPSTVNRWIIRTLSVCVSACPVSLWIIENHRYGDATGRQFDLHKFLDAQAVESLLQTISIWLFPGTEKRAVFALVVFATLSVVILSAVILARRDEKMRSGIDALLVFVACYTGLILVSAGLYESDLLWDSTRILLPLHVCGLFLVAVGLRGANRYYRRFWPVLVSGVLCTVGVLFFISNGLNWINAVKIDGQGYSSRAYRESPIVDSVNKLSDDLIIYTNHDSPLILYADRFPLFLPLKINNETGKPNPDFNKEMAQMARQLKTGEAVLVYFNEGDDWFSYPSLEEITQRLPLVCVDKEDDGSIWGSGQQPSEKVTAIKNAAIWVAGHADYWGCRSCNKTEGVR